jgi:dTDP-4-amino-4,6-dideoxygalactose transaminase
MLRVKLRQLDHYNAARSKAASYYDEAFAHTPELQTPSRSLRSTHTFHQYTLRVLNGQRDELMQYLTGKGIPNKVYYPVPIHDNKPYAESCRYEVSELSNTLQLAKEVISLPMHTELSEDQLQYVTAVVNAFFGR